MTAEMAAFFRRMLSVGLSDAYQQYMEIALEEENPPSNLLLDLAFCLSDTNKTISILDDYIRDCTLNESNLYSMIVLELQKKVASGILTTEQYVKAVFAIMESGNLCNNTAWKTANQLSYLYCDAKNDYLTMDEFLATFSAYMLP